MVSAKVKSIPELHYESDLAKYDTNPWPGEGVAPAFDPEAFEQSIPDTFKSQNYEITASQEVANFYAASHVGLRFHAPYRLGGHLYYSQGQDIDWPARTRIPFWMSAVVYANYYSSILGYVTVIWTGHHFFSFMHIVNRLPVGTRIVRGTIIGDIAAPTDPHGSAWTGPHVAIHCGTALASWYGVGCTDPLPWIVAAR